MYDPVTAYGFLTLATRCSNRPFPGGPKLVGVDLKTDQVFKKILFPQEVSLPTTYLNDVRFDLRHRDEGIAYITDSSQNGPNGIIVVDLAYR